MKFKKYDRVLCFFPAIIFAFCLYIYTYLCLLDLNILGDVFSFLMFPTYFTISVIIVLWHFESFFRQKVGANGLFEGALVLLFSPIIVIIPVVTYIKKITLNTIRFFSTLSP